MRLLTTLGCVSPCSRHVGAGFGERRCSILRVCGCPDGRWGKFRTKGPSRSEQYRPPFAVGRWIREGDAVAIPSTGPSPPETDHWRAAPASGPTQGSACAASGFGSAPEGGMPKDGFAGQGGLEGAAAPLLPLPPLGQGRWNNAGLEASRVTATGRHGRSLGRGPAPTWSMRVVHPRDGPAPRRDTAPIGGDSRRAGWPVRPASARSARGGSCGRGGCGPR